MVQLLCWQASQDHSFISALSYLGASVVIQKCLLVHASPLSTDTKDKHSKDDSYHDKATDAVSHQSSNRNERL